MTKYAYISCLGNVYTSDDPNCDNEPCEMCGDYDRCIGTVNTPIDLAKVMLEEGLYGRIHLRKDWLRNRV